MSFGIRIAFEKSRARWLLLLGPAIILAGLTWLATGGRPAPPDGPWQAEVLARPEGVDRVDVEATLAGSRLRVSTVAGMPPGRLVEGRSTAPDNDARRLEADTDGALARVRLRDRRHKIPFLPRTRESWELRLPAELPLRLQLEGAGLGGDLDLTAGDFEGLKTEGIFMGVDARLPAPRQDTEIQLNGVFQSLDLVVPEGTPVRVHGPGLPFNVVTRRVRGVEGRPGYDVRVQGVFHAVEVRTDPAISPEPPPLPASPPAPSAPPGLPEQPPAAGRLSS
jgi:hypothetical protein